MPPFPLTASVSTDPDQTSDEVLAIDLENISIDMRGSSSSISAMSDLTLQRRQVGHSGRSDGGGIGRVVRSANALCIHTVKSIKNLEQECQGSVSLLINQQVLVFDTDEKNFSQVALKLKGLFKRQYRSLGVWMGSHLLRGIGTYTS